jgi:hypothetical protein
MKTMTIKLAAAIAAALALVASPLAQAAPSGGGGGGVAAGPGGHGNWQGGNGGWNHGGGWGHRGGHWGGWGYGPFWGGLGLGIGFGSLAYPAPYYYGGYYAYPYPGYIVGPGVADYLIVEPATGDRVVRSSGQPVPATRAPDPIFYPKNGQTPARTETDTQECNRWATTQAGAMSDASIFQRATFACMEGRGYTVR